MSTEIPTVSENAEDTGGAQSKQNARVLQTVALIVIMLLVLWGAYKTTRIGMNAWAAYQSALALRTHVEAGDVLAGMDLIHADVAALNQAVTRLNADVAPLMPIFDGLAHLPRYGPTLAALPELSASGVRFLDLGEQALGVVGPALADTNGDLITRGVEVLRQSGDELAALAPLAAAAAAPLAELEPDGAHPALVDELKLARDAAPALPAMLRLSPELPGLLGFEGPKSYLLLIQNNHELRATGGFITAVARVTLDQGRITDLDVVDSYQIFSRASEYPSAPEPMQRYMQLPLMLLRDANWSPDLPTTAALVRALYQQDTGIRIDGVVTADMHAFELLVAGLGSLQMAGLDQPLTRENAIDLIKEFWQNPDGEGGVSGGSTAESREEFNQWWQQRKDFMPALAGAILQRLQNGDVDPVAFMQAGITALNERAVQAALSDPEAAQVFADLGWDGSIEPQPEHDFLALIDTNMGYNKVDAVIERTLDYRVEWSEANVPGTANAPGTANVSITYRHPIDVPAHECDLTPRYGENYDDMTERCYFDYVRLYVPGGSKLIEATGLEADSVSSRPGERGTQVFAGYFVLKPGEETTVSFTYQLPASISADAYTLVVQRQAGSQPLPVSVQVGADALQVVLESGRLEWTPQE